MLSLIYSDIIKASHFHSTKHLIDNLYAINDGEFDRSLYVIYPKDLEVKVEGQGDHTMFLKFGYNRKGRNLLYISHMIKEIPFPFKLGGCLT